MILLDTGPLVALFDPRDPAHATCRSKLAALSEPLLTTLPVLTEAFHLLSPGSQGCVALAEFIRRGGVMLWHMDDNATGRALHLMDKYRDHPMDLADASLVAAAEHFRTQRVFSLDRADFTTYRARLGASYRALRLI